MTETNVPSAEKAPLRVFMCHLTQTLKTKTGCTGWRITKATRAAYGACVGYLRQHPEDQPVLSAYLDMTPRDRDPDWYVGALRGWVEERQQLLRQQEVPCPELQRLMAPIGRSV